MKQSAKERARKAVHKAKSASKSAANKTKQFAASKKRGTHVTSSGKKLRVYSNVSKRRVKKDVKSRRKAEYLATLPKSKFKRMLHRLSPLALYHYWFSRDGAIMAMKLAGISFAVLAVLIIGVFAFFRKDLPNPSELSNRLLNQTTKFYDRTGEVLLFEVYGDENRTVVEFDQISDYAKHATVAIEDKDFYNHGGFSFTGIARAAYNNVLNKGAVKQGGSTITQQFIKNSLLTSERTFTRKIKELVLSIELERLYSKDEILAFYLNEISYGAQAYGIEAAAQSYFSKSSAELTLDEAAMLAAMPQAPTYYSPYGENTAELRGRQSYVLDQMADQGYITQEEADNAKDVDTVAKVTPISERSLYRDIKAPHFVLEVQKQLENEFGASVVNAGGLKVITTLDWGLQGMAEEAVASNIGTVVNAPGGGGGDNTALSASDVSTGQVLAQVGSRDFNYPGYGSFNAALSGRQPGSSFKPFGYSEMFKSDRWGPGSVIFDTPTDFGGGYTPKNYDSTFKGPMTIRSALAQSRNIPAVKALYIAGVPETIDLARAMGNKSLCEECDFGLSLVLGAGEVKLAEHVHAYSTFARGGIYKEQSYVLKVENANGDVIEEWSDSQGERVLDEQLSYLVTSMLSDDTARSATFGRNNPRLVVPGLVHTVKTGSTDAARDGWMMGYTDCTAAGVWVGNHDNKPMNSSTSTQTGPIWTEFMKRANEARGCGTGEIQARPEGIKEVTIDTSTGRQASDNSGSRATDLFPSWYKPIGKGEDTKAVYDVVSGKLATDCTPERAREERQAQGVVPEIDEDDPSFARWAASAPYGATSATTTNSDDVHNCSDAKPSVSLSVNKLNSSIYKFTASVSRGTHPMQTLNFIVNGQIVSAQVNGGGTGSFVYDFGSTGSKTVRAEVIDAALYESSDSKSVNVTSVYSPSGGSITSPGNGSTVLGNTIIVWSTEPAADSYTVCYGKTGQGLNCVNTSSSSYNPPGNLSSGQYQAYVVSKVGGYTLNQSSTITFTVL